MLEQFLLGEDPEERRRSVQGHHFEGVLAEAHLELAPGEERWRLSGCLQLGELR